MSKDPNMQLAGLFIEFSEDELTALYSYMEDCGLSGDVKGVKDFLLSSMEESEYDEPPRASTYGGVAAEIAEALKKNPEIIGQFGSLGTTIFNKIRKKPGN